MRNRLTAALAAALLASCTVGPHYEKPAEETAERFDQATPEATAEPAAPKLWSAFGSTELDALIARAMAANTTIAQAGARYNESRALSGLSVYSWFPTVGVSAQREKAQFSSQDPLAPGGTLLFAVSLRSFVLEDRATAGLEAREITDEITPRDFARRPRLRAWILSRGALHGGR